MPVSEWQKKNPPTHYVMCNGVYARDKIGVVYVKEADFFISQGGLTQKWGKKWIPVYAESIGDARRKGAALFGITLSSMYKNEK